MFMNDRGSGDSDEVWWLSEHYVVRHQGSSKDFGPYRYQVIAGAWGILQWLRQWRDVGWAPSATFTATWRSPDLPGGEDTSIGTIGSQDARPEDVFGSSLSNGTSSVQVARKRNIGLPEARTTNRRVQRGINPGSHNSSTSDTAFLPLNATMVGLPEDNWRRVIDRDGFEYQMTVTGIGDPMVLLADMYDVTFDCLLHYILIVSHPLFLLLHRELLRQTSFDSCSLVYYISISVARRTINQCAAGVQDDLESSWMEDRKRSSSLTLVGRI